MPMTIDDGRAYVALAAYNFHSLRSLIGRSLASGLGGPLRRAFYTAALSLFKTGPQEIQLFFPFGIMYNSILRFWMVSDSASLYAHQGREGSLLFYITADTVFL